MKTVLGDILIGWDNFPDNQLIRCKKHKIYEADLMMKMPKYTSFLDIGSHYGDTILTMTLHAKNNNRTDIRFFAFEPNISKCKHIKKIADLNDLNIIIFNNCVGNNNNTSKARPSGEWNEQLGCCSYINSVNGTVDIIKLNDIRSQIEPVGIMHIDTEGWEAKVLSGASDILNNTINKMYIIAECWTIEEAIGRGIYNDQEQDIMNKIYSTKYTRMKDLIDCEKNLVIKIN